MPPVSLELAPLLRYANAFFYRALALALRLVNKGSQVPSSIDAVTLRPLRPLLRLPIVTSHLMAHVIFIRIAEWPR